MWESPVMTGQGDLEISTNLEPRGGHFLLSKISQSLVKKPATHFTPPLGSMYIHIHVCVCYVAIENKNKRAKTCD